MSGSSPHDKSDEQIFWLIERGQEEKQTPTLWWIGDRNIPSLPYAGRWTENANEAKRWKHKADAEAVAREKVLHLYRITEHAFLKEMDAALTERSEPTEHDQRYSVLMSRFSRAWENHIRQYGNKMDASSNFNVGPWFDPLKHLAEQLTLDLDAARANANYWRRKWHEEQPSSTPSHVATITEGETPRTNEAIRFAGIVGARMVPVEFAQQLERELIAAQTALNRYLRWTPEHTVDEWCAELAGKLEDARRSATATREIVGWVLATGDAGYLSVRGPQYHTREAAEEDAKLPRARGVHTEVWECARTTDGKAKDAP